MEIIKLVFEPAWTHEHQWRMTNTSGRRGLCFTLWWREFEYGVFIVSVIPISQSSVSSEGSPGRHNSSWMCNVLVSRVSVPCGQCNYSCYRPSHGVYRFEWRGIFRGYFPARKWTNTAVCCRAFVHFYRRKPVWWVPFSIIPYSVFRLGRHAGRPRDRFGCGIDFMVFFKGFEFVVEKLGTVWGGVSGWMAYPLNFCDKETDAFRSRSTHVLSCVHTS